MSGNQLVAPLGLTSARWQVMGSIARASQPEPVVSLARAMGVTRQNVQRIVNDLESEGIVSFCPNPGHKRALLVVLTDTGKDLFDRALALQRRWIARLGEPHACAGGGDKNGSRYDSRKTPMLG